MDYSPPKPEDPDQRRVPWLLIIAAVLVLAVIGGISIWSPWDNGKKTSRPSDKAAATSTMPPEKDKPAAAASVAAAPADPFAAPWSFDQFGNPLPQQQTLIVLSAPAPTATAPSPAPAADPVPPAPRPPVRVTRTTTTATGPCTSQDSGREFRWRTIGARPYAATRSEAFSDAKLDRMLYCTGVPQAHWAAIKQQLRTTAGKATWMPQGTAIGDMVFDRRVGFLVPNVIVDVPGGVHGLVYEVEVEGVSYAFFLPFECWNWTRMRIRAPPRRSNCYDIYYNYRTQSDIRKVNDAAVVSVHFPLTQAQVNALVQDPCTFVMDAEGNRFKPSLGRSTIICPPEYVSCWLPDAAARAAGLPLNRLPNGELHGAINFPCPKGRCKLSLPPARLDELIRTVHCVGVHEYASVTPGLEGWRMYARFDIVRVGELQRTRSAGRLDRTLRGAKRS
ncbi:MAG TPA: hypothetical protein VEA36_00445 [Candidatus Paceibacterota bacterium]|nr:hypothetical protein [Candidatus Paceibacterota bacterium]